MKSFQCKKFFSLSMVCVFISLTDWYLLQTDGKDKEELSPRQMFLHHKKGNRCGSSQAYGYHNFDLHVVHLHLIIVQCLIAGPYKTRRTWTLNRFMTSIRCCATKFGFSVRGFLAFTVNLQAVQWCLYLLENTCIDIVATSFKVT